MEISFSKYEGAGNHFIFVEDIKGLFPEKNSFLIEKMCDARFGIGADGLILVRPSQKADFQMRIFNKDGFEAKGCGNGLRCFVRFLEDENLFSGRVSIETFSGIVFGSLDKEEVVIELAYSPLKPEKLFSIDTMPLYFVDTGAPHVVLAVSQIEKIPFYELARKIRHHPFFGKEGVNVNFMEKVGSSFKVRTFEKGVEEETFACGTGAIAVALVQKAFLGGKREVKLIFKGGMITVRIQENIVMKGPANFVFKGNYLFKEKNICQQKLEPLESQKK